MPSPISIGTKMLESSAHLAEAEPTNRFTTAVSSTMPTTVTWAGRLRSRRKLAPLSAISRPTLELLNAAMNWAAKNAMTR